MGDDQTDIEKKTNKTEEDKYDNIKQHNIIALTQQQQEQLLKQH